MSALRKAVLASLSEGRVHARARARARAPRAAESRATKGRRKDQDALSAYVHLPFCRRKCFYCDFPVVALGKESSGTTQFESYVNVLCKEIRSYAAVDGRRREEEAVAGEPLKTVFFGGGTPSLIPPAELERVLATIEETFGIDSNAEISMEADPGTFDRQKLSDFVGLGVNRLSMGVQSFDSKLLELCGRSHSLEDVYQAIEDMHAVSPPSWSMDLMFGLPHQNRETWQNTLEQAIEAEPDHISCYDLQIEDGTPFAKWYDVGLKPLPGEDTGAEFFKLASTILSGCGYLHYEISNYAKKGHESKHNITYWHNKPFYAFGLGSTSYLHETRIQRPRKMREYEAWVSEEEEVEGRKERESKEDLLLDSIMLRLRLSEGLHLEGLDEKFGISGVEGRIWEAVQEYVARNLVQVGEGRRIRLTDPEGFLLSNTIISDIFASIDEYPAQP